MTESNSKRLPRLWLVLALAIMTLLVGIAGFYLGKNSGRPVAGSGESEIHRFAPEELEPLGDPLPPIDEKRERVKIAPPKGWTREPNRPKEYLVRFRKFKTHPLPQIEVTVEDADFSEPANVDAENLRQFGKRMAQPISDAVGRALMEQPILLMLGDVPCVRYIRSNTFMLDGKRVPGKSEVLLTLSAGRIYKLTLDTNPEQLVDYRASLYAVAAGMEFDELESDQTENAVPGAEGPEDSTPADKKTETTAANQ